MESLPVQSFDEVFACVESGRGAFGMVPIENSTTGSIYQNYDSFSHHDGVVIAGALAVRISHALLAPSGTSLADIRTVYSQQNKVSALYDCLGVCKDAGLNLTKLESRPIPGCPWSYRFFADAAIPSGSEGPGHAVASFTELLRKVTEEIRILGVYRE